LNKKEELPALWERLIRVDYEEGDAVVLLANQKEAKGEKEEAIAYYKRQ
jgi:transcription elongation factor GreA-like protein